MSDSAESIFVEIVLSGTRSGGSNNAEFTGSILNQLLLLFMEVKTRNSSDVMVQIRVGVNLELQNKTRTKHGNLTKT